MGAFPTVLVVDDDAVIRRLVRTGLELENLRVLEAGTLAQVRAILGEAVDGVVLDRRLSDGDGLDLVPELQERWPQARIVVHTVDSDPTGGGPSLASAPKGDVAAIIDALGLGAGPVADAMPSVTGEQAERLRHRWEELCRWDPALPPDATPVLAESVVRGLGAALERPQPLGWGLDPALESIAEALAVNAASVDEALAQLVCLHEAFLQTVVADLPPAEREETRNRVDMIVHRTMVVAGQTSVRRLAEEALTDPLTGVRNRRAFEVDLEREVARARRHGRPLTLAVIDVDGLKAINDRRGHGAGDEILRALAAALHTTLRHEDGAYRIGGDEFALILVDTEVLDEDVVSGRLAAAGAPACSVGLARLPSETTTPAGDLVIRADARLYEVRRRRGVEARPPAAPATVTTPEAGADRPAGDPANRP